MIEGENIIRALAGTGQVRILVFGDYTLDKYLYIDPARDEPSVETGLTAYQVHEKRMYAGCGGTITNNLRALGARVISIGLMGEDGEGYELQRCLDAVGADTASMVRTGELCTCTYTKPMRLQPDGSWQEMNRLDFRNFTPPSMELQQRLLERLEERLGEADAVILIDQFCQRNLGVITDYVRGRLNELARAHPEKNFYVDSRAFSGEFRNMIVKCNNLELMASAPEEAGSAEDPQALLRQAQLLRSRTGNTFFVTRGSQGMLVLQGETAISVPAVHVTGPIDIVGAGDASSAGIVLGLTLGLTAEEAAALGCCVSSITIQQLGVTGRASVPQVVERLRIYQEGKSV